MPSLLLTILGPPLGKGRPRFAPSTGHAYTPKSTAEWQGRARADVATQLPAEWLMLSCPCAIFVTAVFDRPGYMVCEHTSGRCKCEEKYPQSERIVCDGRFDGDNIEKIVWDTLQEAGALKNDKAVVVHGARKFYGAVTERSETVVSLVWGDDLGRLPWPPDHLEDW